VIATTIGGVCVIVGAISEGVSGFDVIVDRVILVHFLGDAEVRAGVFLSEAGGRISIIGVASKCCDFGRAVVSSSVCLTTSIGYCNANSLMLVCLVPGWLWVIRFLF
jgi:hypothetical protein